MLRAQVSESFSNGRLRALYLCLRLELKPHQFTLLGTIWGLWIAGCAKYSPEPWGKFYLVTVLLARRRGVSSLLLRGACSGNVYDGNVGHGSLRTALWETQWGQLDGLFALNAPWVQLELQSGFASALPCLVKSLLPSGGLPWRFGAWLKDSYLVDSASSHMLVSKIKPCMSKYKQLYRETANGSLNQLSFI